jgi:hypothetical protein
MLIIIYFLFVIPAVILGFYLANKHIELNKARQAVINKIIDDLHK